MEQESTPKTSSKPLFTIDLGKNGGRLSPRSNQALKNWIKKEREFWGFFRASGYDDVTAVMSQKLRPLSDLTNLAEDLDNSSKNPAGITDRLNAIQQGISQLWGSEGLPHSSTVTAKAITSLAAQKDTVAVAFFLVGLGVLSTSKSGPSKALHWQSMVNGAILNLGQSDKLSAIRAHHDETLSATLADAQRATSEQVDAIHDLRDSASELAQELRTMLADQREDNERAHRERANAFSEQSTTQTAEFESIKATFLEQMALRGPIDYWKSKAASHKQQALKMGRWSFASIAAAGGLLVWQAHDLLSGPNPEPWRLGLLALIGVFALWAARLVVRMFLSHLHLQTDAEERVVMAQTYLALHEADQLADKDDRQLILQALFRPASDGIVKDEALPASIGELLTRAR